MAKMPAMNLELDPDVQFVAEFMQGHIAAERLVSTASSLAAIAPLLWGHHQHSASVSPLSLRLPPITAQKPGEGRRIRPGANE
jgi:hypothetical protein